MKKSLLAVVALSAVAGVAQADVSLYGIIDMGIANLTSGASSNPSMPAGVPTQLYVTNNGGKAVTTIAPNGMSQSVLGFKGSEDVSGDLKVGFILEAGINANSGTITDGISGLTQGNFKTSTGGDSSRAGQLFNQRSLLYVSSKDMGTISFGRQYSTSLDQIVKYDPMGGSYAFSLVGFYGSYGGGGWTEDARLDNSIKYEGKFGAVRVGAMYQFGGIAGSNSANSAGQFALGTDVGNFSTDAFVSFKKDGLGTFPSTTGAPNNMLGVVSDNKAEGLNAKYKFSRLTLSGGAEHIVYSAPSDPTMAFSGALPIGAYQVGQYGAPNTSAYAAVNKTVNLVFFGGKYEVTSNLDLIASAYNARNSNYTGSAGGGCASGGISGASFNAGRCAGFLQSYGLVLDYHLSKRTDIYAGISDQNSTGGVTTFYNIGANATNNAADQNTTTMVGIRHRF
ncbi:MAG: porin [Betaproteobacteria bacterium]|nr:porin [Betaproteobacteria bacterium]